MNDNETTADVIAAMRDEAARADIEQEYSIDDAAEMMREFAWRFEAAHKREIEATAAKCCQLGRDAAKLRGAVAELIDVMYELGIDENTIVIAAESKHCHMNSNSHLSAIKKAKAALAALAAPPRNCDRYASAEEAWDAYDEWADSYRAQGKTEPFNEVGWLFATATEVEKFMEDK